MKLNSGRTRRDRGRKGKTKNSSTFLYFLIIFIFVISVLSFYTITHSAQGVSYTPAMLTSYVLPDSFINSSQHTRLSPKRNDKQSPPLTAMSTVQDGSLQTLNDNNKNIIANKRLQVAFAITITRDGKFQDGAAVMAYSIDQAFRNDNMDISMIAFVHPNVSTSRPVLEKVGYRVIETPTPVNVTAIRGKWLREHINDKAGCCGAAELIKLYAYRLVEYDWVIHLDADVLIFQSFSEILTEDGFRNRSLIYTTDPNMASFKGEEKLPVQGGFLVIKPSLTDYQRLIDIIMEGNYKGSSAWGGTKIGWFWGGKTIQGVLAYYYQHVEPRSRGLRLDRCIYNTMADSDRCRATPMDEIKTAHYTVCLKPWSCPNYGNDLLCGQLHSRWHEMRKEAEIYYGISDPDIESCALGPKKRGRKYQPLRLHEASLPESSILLSNAVGGRNDGVRTMRPLPGAGFIDIDRGTELSIS